MVVTPFRIEVPEAALDDLRARLARTRWPDTLSEVGWESGAALSYVRELAEYWRMRFDWRAQEAALNRWPQFRAEVEGHGLHFLHVRGRGPRPLPLLLTHGWPGSFLEMLKILPLLADPEGSGGDPEDAFDVVVPSLPGYGFSERPRERGMDAARIAELWLALMAQLGYERFGLQGGDWGASVSTWLARRHPERVAGLHLNYVPGSYRPHLAAADTLSDAERIFLADKQRWVEEEAGYGHVQATRPQTLAYGLHDSPVGLAAWIVEKFQAWSDCGGDVERRFTKDELLTNITLYWVTETIHSSMRLYQESARRPLALEPGERIGVPTGVARFPGEAPSPPREWVARGYQLVHWGEQPHGGHFAAMEEPGLLAEDVRAFFRPLRGAGHAGGGSVAAEPAGG